MAISKISVIFLLVITLSVYMSNYNVLGASGPPNCIAQCVPGKYGVRECVHDCVMNGYSYGTCAPPYLTGKCCCTKER
ncbi:hypothetical protein N665_0373s0036 [Sinapis alba]|nr:hypothetical protein N665_0373s0036 [Sinapis alba]